MDISDLLGVNWPTWSEYGHNNPTPSTDRDPSGNDTNPPRAEDAQGQLIPPTLLPPVLPLPRPLSPIDLGISAWDSYESPPQGDIGSKRRRNRRATSPPEAPPRKGRRIGSASPTSILTTPGSHNETPGTSNPVLRGEIPFEAEQVPTADRAYTPDDVENADRQGAMPRTQVLQVGSEEAQPRLNVTAGTTSHSPPLHTNPKALIPRPDPSRPSPKKLTIKYSQLRRRASGFQGQNEPTSHESKTPPRCRAIKATHTGDTLVAHTPPGSPLEAGEGAFADETGQHTSEGHSLTPMVPSSPLISTLIGVEPGPRINHGDTRSKSAQDGGSLSVQSSFRSFSSEEEGDAPGSDAGGDAGLSNPEVNEIQSPRPISVDGSFLAFSDEEVEEGQNFSKPAWPNILFRMDIAMPESSALAPNPPVTQVDPQNTTRRGWASWNIPTTARVKHGEFVKRTRRVKFDAQRPFIPPRRPFTPPTSASIGGQGITTRSSFTVLEQPLCSTSLAHPSRPAVGHDTADNLGYYKATTNVASIASSYPSPTKAGPGAGNNFPDSQNRAAQHEHRKGPTRPTTTKRIPRATVQTSSSESRSPSPTPAPGKGKGRAVDVAPVLPPSASISTSQRFAGLKEKIIGSLENMFPGGDGRDPGNYESLSRGETNLDLALARLAEGDMGAPATRQDICSLLLLLRGILREHTAPETPEGVPGSTPRKTTRRQVMQQRSVETLALQSAIRLYARELMGRLKEDDNEEPAPIPIASARDLENFKTHRIQPTESYFRLDVSGTRRSPWNKALVSVFAHCFIGSTWYQGESIELVKNAFSVHLQTLIKNWKAQQRRSEVDMQDDDDIQRGLNADQRRRSLWKRRYKAATSRNELSDVAAVLKDAGMRVVSADEADGDISRHLILRLPWRSTEATQFLRRLDKIHIANKYKATGRPGPGRWPTPRNPSTKRVDNDSEPPPGLPVNFYDEDWLRDIGVDGRRELHARPPMELAFSDSTTQLIARHDPVRGRPHSCS